MRNVMSSAIGLLLIAPVTSHSSEIDRERSTITIQVDKAGLLASFGDRHVIQAPITHGSIREAEQPAIEFEIDSRGLKVVDPDLASEKRLEVQNRMHGQSVLDAERYPTITFHSTAIEVAGEKRWRVTGNLTVRGVTRSVVVTVSRPSEQYVGSVVVRQRDFGIEPVAVAGGLVKVKNEIRIEFAIASR